MGARVYDPLVLRSPLRLPIASPSRRALAAGLSTASIVIAATLSALGQSSSFPGRPDPSPLLGTPAPPLEVDAWLDEVSSGIDALRGRVLVVRWWTDTCPFCATSAPALRSLHERYASRGLSVIGVFHPKPPGEVDRERAARAVERFGFSFPVAIDADWDALRAWWLDRVEGGWTSVTFVVDREGIVRWIHPGGEYHTGEAGGHWDDHSSCRAEHDELLRVVESLLADAEPTGTRGSR